MALKWKSHARKKAVSAKCESYNVTTDERVFIGLGSNLGDRTERLRQAQQKLLESQTIRLVLASSIYETDPVGKTDQPLFLNQVIEIRTTLAPEDLLTHLLQVEQELGRVRRERWGPRIIDLDVLAFGQRVEQSKRLVLPHPELHRRRFVLQPWAEIAPEFEVAVFSTTVADLLQKCSDKSRVKKLET
jgi:2-amino-4-hydroxy-6-hydroxymethyldihydropteridine diphosphokinase